MEFGDRDMSLPCAGGWLEVKVVADRPLRRGVITELVGAPGHQHFRKRRDERYESIVDPVFTVLGGRRSQQQFDGGS